MEGFRRQDPLDVPQIAVPVAVPEAAIKLTSLTSEKNYHAVGYLITIEFYYLLQSGNYTKPQRIKKMGGWFAPHKPSNSNYRI